MHPARKRRSGREDAPPAAIAHPHSSRSQQHETAGFRALRQCTLVGLLRVDILHPRPAWSLAARLEHGVDYLRRSGEHGLDRSVAAIARPAFQTVQFGLMLRPGPEADALDDTADADVDDPAHAHDSPLQGLGCRSCLVGADQRGWTAGVDPTWAGGIPTVLGSSAPISRT